MYYKMNEDFLAHYGVLGMKWGRRKQRPISRSNNLMFDRKQIKMARKQNIKQYKLNKKKAKALHKEALSEYKKKRKALSREQFGVNYGLSKSNAGSLAKSISDVTYAVRKRSLDKKYKDIINKANSKYESDMKKSKDLYKKNKKKLSTKR